MKNDDFSLVLDCAGFRQDSFVLCCGTSNIIVDFTNRIDSTIIDFLNFGCKLLDGPVYDWNKIVNIVKVLHDNYDYIDHNTWESLYMWFPLHKRCGAVLRIVFNDEL